MKKIAKWLHTQRILIFAVLVMALLGIGATMALFTDTEAAVNTFTVGNNTITVTEEPENLTKKNIGITNNGTIPVYVRMQVNVPENIKYLATEDGKEVEKTLTAKITLDPETNSDWILEGDFYYYRKVLDPKDSVKLFKEVALVDSETLKEPFISEEQMKIIKHLLDITVYGESVQSEGFPKEVMADIAAETAKENGNPAKVAFEAVAE